MKWLVLASSLKSKNGYGVLCASVVSALRRSGRVELDVVTADGSGDFGNGSSARHRLVSERITWHPSLWRWYVLRDLITLWRATSGPYDGVLVLVEHYGPVGWLFARWKGIPCVVTQCGSYAIRFPDEIPFFKKMLKGVARVLPISRYTRACMEAEGIDARYTVVTLGVDRSRYHPVPIERRREILFVGNLKARKGFDFLLDAVLVARRSVPDVHVRVVGEVDTAAPESAAVLQRIRDENISVEFITGLDDAGLAAAYARARLNALPSHSARFFFEGFGLVHLEANACGTLTVGTLHSGNEDAIGKGFGSLVEYGDVAALAGIIVDAMTRDPYPALAVETLRTWDAVARDYADILETEVRQNKRIFMRETTDSRTGG
jgi:glycosyltransferase involved in cell wall biosynthesis